MPLFWNPDDSFISNMMIDTSPWSFCPRRSPWLYNEFYRAECITVSGFFLLHWYLLSLGGIASWYFVIFNKYLRWITIKQESVTKVLANIWLLATPCCIIWPDPFYLHSRPKRLFIISMLIVNSKKIPVLHSILNKHYLITCFPFLPTSNS